MPGFTTDALWEQYVRDLPGELVFPSARGTVRTPANFRRTWRTIRGDDYAWVTPHNFRDTAATIVAEELGADAAAAQLGHTDAKITRVHYIEASPLAPDATAALDRLAPTQRKPNGNGRQEAHSSTPSVIASAR